ncbi:hypothetical protein K1719_022074 [Acacia pycnantha]|nr:hypothetical protein K1719_022074 [Acacia pycnantha]
MLFFVLKARPSCSPFNATTSIQEAPAVIKSYYDKRIVGCLGSEGEDEHNVVWFWLEKGKPHECPVCSQYVVLLCEGKGNLSSLQQENGPEVKCQGPLLILRCLVLNLLKVPCSLVDSLEVPISFLSNPS